MEKIGLRQLRELSGAELIKRLPLILQIDNQAIAVIVAFDRYNAKSSEIDNQLVISAQLDNQLKLYNPAIHKPGDKVLVRRGKRLIPQIVPHLDAEGNSIDW